jgi:fatty acid synthase
MSFEPTLYSDIIANDLVINVFADRKCGTYRHLSYDNELFNATKECSHAYLNPSRVGDLSSIKWFEAEHKYWPIGKTSDQILVNVYYSGLNFKDIMYASGRLSSNESAILGNNCRKFSVIYLTFITT